LYTAVFLNKETTFGQAGHAIDWVENNLNKRQKRINRLNDRYGNRVEGHPD
jgi:hypothetical protein